MNNQLTDFQQLDAWLDSHRVTEIECLVPDLTGMARGKILPRGKFQTDRGMNLPELILGMTVTGNTPEDSDYFRVISDVDLDLVLKPDTCTARVVPWAIDPTAMVIHDCFNASGDIINYAPRSVLRRVLSLYAEQGWVPVIAPELEFYLVARNTDPNEPLCPPIGRSGRAEVGRQAYSIDAVNEFDPLFEDIYAYCDKQQLDIDTLIHEIGTGQMEINFLHGDAMVLADSVFLFKRTVREVAFRHNMYATFMAKPMAHQPGSAMHLHISVVGAQTGLNIFSQADGTPSQLFGYFIGGLQRYLPHAMSIFAPYVNSYRRLIKNSAAPTNVRWGIDNRTVGLRVPHAKPAARRVENRLVGADTNPYLAMSATLACGYLGMQEKIQPSAEMQGNAYNHDHELPLTLRQSLRLLEQCHPLHQILSPEFITVFLSVKHAELDEFNTVISPWERANLLLNV